MKWWGDTWNSHHWSNTTQTWSIVWPTLANWCKEGSMTGLLQFFLLATVEEWRSSWHSSPYPFSFWWVQFKTHLDPSLKFFQRDYGLLLSWGRGSHTSWISPPRFCAPPSVRKSPVNVFLILFLCILIYTFTNNFNSLLFTVCFLGPFVLWENVR